MTGEIGVVLVNKIFLTYIFVIFFPQYDYITIVTGANGTRLGCGTLRKVKPGTLIDLTLA